MTDRKHETVTLPDIKGDEELSPKAAFYVMRLVREPVLPKDVYTPNDVACLLGIDKRRVYAYASRPVIPMPLRKLPNGSRGSFILRDELIEWLRDSTDRPETDYSKIK